MMKTAEAAVDVQAGAGAGMEEDWANRWQAHDVAGNPNHPALLAGLRVIEPEYDRGATQVAPARAAVVKNTDVTLRDGEQQPIVDVSTEQRVEVFDHIVSTGVDRVEIGHLANPWDQEFAGAVIGRVAAQEEVDSRYRLVQQQVLFGSQEDLIQQGIGVLQAAYSKHYSAGGDVSTKWQTVMGDRTVVHVYDRIDPCLIGLATEPYDQEKSAQRVARAAQYAIDAGFRHFSISGEGGTAVPPEEAIQYNRAIVDHLIDHGAESVNVNLANTFGFSSNTLWNLGTLAAFDAGVKDGFEPGRVTTSIHTHNDVDNAVGFAVTALTAGFDRVEGSINGMGERQGNVALIDVMARIAESARQEHEQQLVGKDSMITRQAAQLGLRRQVRLDPAMIDNLPQWYRATEAVSAIYGPDAQYRFHRTAVGSPYAFHNGSGPHDQAMKRAIADPLRYPPYRIYEWMLSIDYLLGRPLAKELAIGDPDAVKAVTVAGRAGGGSTRAILGGDVERADPNTVQAAKAAFEEYAQAISKLMSAGTTLIAG